MLMSSFCIKINTYNKKKKCWKNGVFCDTLFCVTREGCLYIIKVRLYSTNRKMEQPCYWSCCWYDIDILTDKLIVYGAACSLYCAATSESVVDQHCLRSSEEESEYNFVCQCCIIICSLSMDMHRIFCYVNVNFE